MPCLMSGCSHIERQWERSLVQGRHLDIGRASQERILRSGELTAKVSQHMVVTGKRWPALAFRWFSGEAQIKSPTHLWERFEKAFVAMAG